MKEHTAPHIVLITLCIIAIVIGMVISAFMLSRFMLKVQTTTEKSITTKGVAEKEIVSDLAAFYCNISVKNKNRSDGYVDLDRKIKILHAKLKHLGFTDDMFEDKNISCEEKYISETVNENNQNITKKYFDHYYITYSLRIRTKNVKLVEKQALKLYELAAQKYDITVGEPQYFISNPEQYKLELVDKASASAAERARTAAKQSGSEIGALIKARHCSSSLGVMSQRISSISSPTTGMTATSKKSAIEISSV